MQLIFRAVRNTAAVKKEKKSDEGKTKHKKLERMLTQSNEGNEDGDDDNIGDAVLDDLNQGDEELSKDKKKRKK